VQGLAAGNWPSNWASRCGRCKGETFSELAAGFGVGTTTAWRYVNETVELLAARAPGLRKAVRDAVKAGYG